MVRNFWQSLDTEHILYLTTSKDLVPQYNRHKTVNSNNLSELRSRSIICQASKQGQRPGPTPWLKPSCGSILAAFKPLTDQTYKRRNVCCYSLDLEHSQKALC
jgi:hypothetical protein